MTEPPEHHEADVPRSPAATTPQFAVREHDGSLFLVAHDGREHQLEAYLFVARPRPSADVPMPQPVAAGSGNIAQMAEAVATFLLRNPALKQAVDGLVDAYRAGLRW